MTPVLAAAARSSRNVAEGRADGLSEVVESEPARAQSRLRWVGCHPSPRHLYSGHMEVIAQTAKNDDALGTICRRLPPPAASVGGAMLFAGDCLDLLKSLPDGCVDLVITSPPYNIGKEYETTRDVDVYLDWCTAWIAQLHRVTKAGGAFWLNLGYLELPGRAKAIPIPYLLWNRVPFHLLQEIVWHYGAGVASRRSFSPRNEKFLWYVKDQAEYVFNLDAVRDPNVKYPNQKKNGKLKCNPAGKNPSDVWLFPKVTSGANRASKERTPHPAQFPLAVIDRIIKACSHEGAIVLDPFMGSGTTAEAATINKRRCLGFELRADYVELAGRRLRSRQRRAVAAEAQLDLALWEQAK